MTTGSPSIAWRMPSKSPVWIAPAGAAPRDSPHGRAAAPRWRPRPALLGLAASLGGRRSSAAWRVCARSARVASAAARIICCTMGRRSSSKNMCSVRQRPMPSAPNSTARCGVARVVGVGPDAQLARLVGPAQQRRPGRAPPRSSARSVAIAPGEDLAGRAVDRDHVAFLTVCAVRRVKLRASSSTRDRSRRPTTHGLPMPRATTAAWLVVPPRAVRMPLRRDHAVHVVRVGLRAHQDHRLAGLAQLSARSASKTALPTGRARRRRSRPFASSRPLASRAPPWPRRRSAAAAVARPGSARRAAAPLPCVIRPSSTMSTAILTAAAAVRLPCGSAA